MSEERWNGPGASHPPEVISPGGAAPPQAAEVLGVSLPRYYQLEDRGVTGLTLACEARPRGRQADAQTELHALKKENERLKKELARYQSLVRLTQRTVGVPPRPRPRSGKRGRESFLWTVSCDPR
ncbi:MAG TPA: hypothetical protein VKE40_19440 [Gemmataceae bacterium]|nr:hypothetical protein [Gemmataceae bacterium]